MSHGAAPSIRRATCFVRPLRCHPQVPLRRAGVGAGANLGIGIVGADVLFVLFKRHCEGMGTDPSSLAIM